MIVTAAASLAALAMAQQVHPDAIVSPMQDHPAVTFADAPEKPAAQPAAAHPVTGKPRKGGLGPTDYAYVMPDGVTTKEVTYYSDGVACYAKIFYPKDFDATGSTPAIVMGQGWGGTHVSIEKYAARFAERGLVAMTIDYRGWGNSEGYVRLVEPQVGGGMERDEHRNEIREGVDVVVTRTRLIAQDQQEDYRNAISFIQGEPGVDANAIGVWGSSYAGGNSVAAAGQDARVKAIAVQIPSINGDPNGSSPTNYPKPLLDEAIKRARTGQSSEMWTGFSRTLLIGSDMIDANRQNNTMQWAKNIGDRPFMVIVAEHEELINNEESGKAAIALATGPTEYIEVPDITHFEMYSGEPFEISSEAAARWFNTHLR